MAASGAHPWSHRARARARAPVDGWVGRCTGDGLVATLIAGVVPLVHVKLKRRAWSPPRSSPRQSHTNKLQTCPRQPTIRDGPREGGGRHRQARVPCHVAHTQLRGLYRSLPSSRAKCSPKSSANVVAAMMTCKTWPRLCWCCDGPSRTCEVNQTMWQDPDAPAPAPAPAELEHAELERAWSSTPPPSSPLPSSPPPAPPPSPPPSPSRAVLGLPLAVHVPVRRTAAAAATHARPTAAGKVVCPAPPPVCLPAVSADASALPGTWAGGRPAGAARAAAGQAGPTEDTAPSGASAAGGRCRRRRPAYAVGQHAHMRIRIHSKADRRARHRQWRRCWPRRAWT
jgi:hypothetical protein